MDELRGRGDPYNQILSSGTTTDYLLAAEIWTPEEVMYFYPSVDEDTKRAVTHALKSWLKVSDLESELEGMVAWELLVKSEIKKIVPREG